MTDPKGPERLKSSGVTARCPSRITWIRRGHLARPPSVASIGAMPLEPSTRIDGICMPFNARPRRQRHVGLFQNT